MRRKTARDRRAEVLGLPLSLAVSLIVCAAVLPAVAVEAGRVMESGARDRMRSECGRIGSAALSVLSAGPGTTVHIDIEVPSGQWGVDRVLLGDSADGPYRCCARFFQDGRCVLVAFDPPAPMTAGGGPLDLGPGSHTLVLVNDGTSGGGIVLVRAG